MGQSIDVLASQRGKVLRSRCPTLISLARGDMPFGQKHEH